MSSPVHSNSGKASLALVFATVCIDLLGFGLVLPLLPIYGRELTEGLTRTQSGFVLGLLMSCFSIMQFVFAPLWGRVSDRVGRRPVLLLSLAGSTVFYGLFGLASTWRSLGWMFLSRIGAGIAGASIPTAQAYIADVTPPDRRTRGMALIGAAFGLGFTLGPLVGAAALAFAPQNPISPWPGFLAAGLSGVALVFAVFLLPESLDPSRIPESRRHVDLASLREALATPSIGALLLTGFLAVFSLANFEGTLSWMIQAKLDTGAATALDRSTAQTMPSEPTPLQSPPTPPTPASRSEVRLFLVFAYIGLIMCLVQGLLVRRLAARVSEAALAVAGSLVSILGFILLAIASLASWAGLGFLMVATAIEVSGIAMIFPAVQSLISRRSDPARQGGILARARASVRSRELRERSSVQPSMRRRTPPPRGGRRRHGLGRGPDSLGGPERQRLGRQRAGDERRCDGVNKPPPAAPDSAQSPRSRRRVSPVTHGAPDLIEPLQRPDFSDRHQAQRRQHGQSARHRQSVPAERHERVPAHELHEQPNGSPCRNKRNHESDRQHSGA